MIKDNKGFGSKEILVVSTVCLILAAILLKVALNTSNREKLKVFEYNARTFASSATTYQMENSNDHIYMMELIDNKLFSPIKNQFGGDKYCDSAESKIDYEDNQKYVTLRCGEYLIDHQSLKEEKFKIYKVNEWTDEKITGNQETQEVVMYNYKADNKDGFEQLYSEDLFLYAFNKKMDTDYHKIEEIPKNYGVYQKTMYRIKELVYTVKNRGKE